LTQKYDVAIVGAGIVGLAHAYHVAKSGKRVLVLERSPRAQGASIRNFGMLWPIGQPPGEMDTLARRSLEIWLQVLQASGLWHARCGSLHLAYHEDEEAVLSEFAGMSPERGCSMLSPSEITSRFSAVSGRGLRSSLLSPTEVTVDPRQIVAELPNYLSREFGVHFEFGARVIDYSQPRLLTVNGEWIVENAIVCTGVDFRELAPEAFADSGLVPCKLQMMRTPPTSQFLGTMIAGGLTLRHYKSFANCPSLPKVIERLDREMPEYHRYGIHVMAAQNGLGEIIIGDSHEYGDAIEPFDKPSIDAMILSYLQTLLKLDVEIASRWHGSYVKHPSEPFMIAKPRPGLTAVTGLGGAGMTLSFGLAERVVLDSFSPLCASGRGEK